jgi:hypothetical protein
LNLKTDAANVPIIAITAFVLGFHQVHFGPAVSLACGHGYATPAWGKVPSSMLFCQSRLRTSIAPN